MFEFSSAIAGFGLATAAYGAVSVALGHRFTAVRRSRRADAAEALPAGYRPVVFPSLDGIRLAAWYVPARNARGAVVMVHGRGAHKGHELEADPQLLVSDLVASGLSVLAIDLRGHGQSDRARMTYGWKERLDVRGGVAWLLAQGYEPGRIGVLGASMGGAAAFAAAAEDDAIGAVATDCAFADFGRVLQLHFPRVLPMRSGRLFLPGTLVAARMIAGAYLNDFRPVEHARRMRGRPALVIHAQGDPFIPVSHAHELAQAADAELWVNDSDRHVGGFGADPQAYRSRVCRFFERGLAPRDTARGSFLRPADRAVAMPA
jgi:fermentation-respiration switch protein FrsA (DUF1100 family)